MKSYNSYFENARSAGRKSVSPVVINQVLDDLADAAITQTDYLLQENQRDLDLMDQKDPKYDRLKLTAERIGDIAKEIRNVALLDTPLGHILSDKTMPNGLQISRVRVPLGDVGVI